MQYFLLSSPQVVDKYHRLAGPEQEHSRKFSTLKEGVSKVKGYFSASEGVRVCEHEENPLFDESSFGSWFQCLNS